MSVYLRAICIARVCVCVCAQVQFVWVCECNFYEFVYCLREEFVSVWVAILLFVGGICVRVGACNFVGVSESILYVCVCVLCENNFCACVCLLVHFVCMLVCVCVRPSDNFSTSKLNSKTFLVDGMKQGGRCGSI